MKRLLSLLFFLTASSATTAQAEPPSSHVTESATISASESSRWQRHYDAGLKDYGRRLYLSAERHLNQALKECGHTSDSELNQAKTRLALGELALSEGKLEEADRLFNQAKSVLGKASGSESLDHAHCLNALATMCLAKGKLEQAESLAKQALEIRQKLLPADDALTGQSLHVLAVALSRQSWFDEAEPVFKRSLAILEKHPGADDLDLADGLRDMALFYQQQGKREDSAKLFARAITLKEKSIRLDMPPAIAGVISFPWDEGAPGSGLIVDGEYPLKYMTAGGLRVAAALIPSMQFVDVLISLKNTSDQPIDLGVGPVNMTVVRPRLKKLERMPPESIDWVQEENTIWDWTHRQPSLAILQQTTMDPARSPLTVPACLECTGGNLWGRYGRWEIIGPTNSSAKARAQSQIESMLLSGEVRWDTVRALDLSMVHMGAGESRSGLVFFFSNPHAGDVILRVFVGNTTFDFPFKISG